MLSFTKFLTEIKDDEKLASTIKNNDGKRKLQFNHHPKKIISHMRKDPELKKHLAGAYTDDNEIVHKKTGQTIAKIGKNSTLGSVKADAKSWAEKNTVKKNVEPVQHVSSTRTIYTAKSDSEAQSIKKRWQDGKHVVRIMPRKNGFKVYVDKK